MAIVSLTKNNDLTVKKSFDHTVETLTLAELASSLNSLIDGAIVTTLIGGYAIAAYALWSPINKIIESISKLFVVGSQINCSSGIGRSNRKQVDGAFSFAVLSLSIIGLILGFVIYEVSESLAMLVGASSDPTNLLKPTMDYFRGISLGIPALFLYNLFLPLLSLNGDNNTGRTATFVMAGTNICGDLLAVLILKEGMFGIGIATSLSYYCAMAVMLGRFIKKKYMRLNIHAIDKEIVKGVLKSGSPAMSGRFILFPRDYITNVLLITFGTTKILSAYSLVMSLIRPLMASFLHGMQTTVILIGNVLFGEEDLHGIKDMFRETIWCIIRFATIPGVILIIVAPWFVPFLSDQSYVNEAIYITRLLGIGITFEACAMLIHSYLQVLGKTLYTYIWLLISNLGTLVLAAWTGGYFFGEKGVVIGTRIMDQFLSLVCFFIFMTIVVKHVPKRWEEFLLLPEDFDVPDKDKMELIMTISPDNVRKEGVARGTFSDAAPPTIGMIVDREMLFLEQHDVSKKYRNWICLALEELLNNSCKIGISDDKDHHIAVKIVYKNDGMVILRVRDDCKAFDPRARLELLSEGDFVSNLGLKIICNSATEMIYSRILDLNVLVFKYNIAAK